MSLKRFHINGKDMFRVDSKTGPFVDASVAEALHDSLVDCLALAELKFGNSDPGASQVFNKARAALAKARGES